MIASICMCQSYHFNVKDIDLSGYPQIKGKFQLYDSVGNLLDLDTSQIVITDENGKRYYTTSYVDCPQRIDDTVALLISLDVSGSMRGQIDTTYFISNAIRSIQHFLGLVNQHSKIFVSFQAYDDKLLYNIPFTNDVNFVRTEFTKSPLGNNNDFTAQILSGLDSLRKFKANKKVFLMFTDGFWWALPDGDISTFTQLCKNNNIRFYLSLFSHPSLNWSFTQQLQKIPYEVGGKVYNQLINDREITNFLADINQELFFTKNGCTFTLQFDKCVRSHTLIFSIPTYDVKDTIVIVNELYDKERFSNIIIQYDDTLLYDQCSTYKTIVKIYDNCGNKLQLGNISNNRFSKLSNDTLLYSPTKNQLIDSVKLTIFGYGDTTIHFTVKDVTSDTIFAILGDTLRNQITINRVIDYCDKDSIIIPVQQLTCVDLIFNGIIAIKDSNTGLYFITLPILPSDQQYHSTIHEFTINGKLITVTINVQTRKNGELLYPHTILSSYDLCKPDSVILVKISNPNCWQQSFVFAGKNYDLLSFDSITIPLIFSFTSIGTFTNTVSLTYSIFDSVIIGEITIITNVYSSQKDSLIANVYSIIDTLNDYCDESMKPVKLFNISCGNNPVKIDTILWNNNNLLVTQFDDSLLFTYSPSTTIDDSSIVWLVYNNYQDTIIISHKISFIQQDTFIVKLNSEIESYTLTDWKANILFDNNIISDSIRISLSLTNEGLSFDFFTYNWNLITSIDTITISDNSLDIILHFNRHEFATGEILLTLFGKSYITQYDSTVLVIDRTQSFVDLLCYDSILVKGNNSIFTIDSCGTQLLRSVLRKNSFIISENPAKDHFTVITESEEEFAVYDLFGTIVFTGVTNKQYSTNWLSQQQYFIGVNSIVGKQLFIIQR